MNDRIKELAAQAEQYALDKANEGNDEDYDYTFDDDFQQKFAQLIVKECADLFDDDPESGTRYTGVGCRDMIKWYFGVKE